MRAAALAALALCPLLAGCFGPQVSRVDPDHNFKFIEDLGPNLDAGAQSPDEPSFCLGGVHDARPGHGYQEAFDLVKAAAPFRAFKALGSDAFDLAGCDIIVWLALDAYPVKPLLTPWVDGGYRGEKMDILSANTGARLDYLWAVGDDDIPLNLLGRALHALFLPGRQAHLRYLVEKGKYRNRLDWVAILGANNMAPIASYGPGAGSFPGDAVAASRPAAAQPQGAVSAESARAGVSSSAPAPVELAEGPSAPHPYRHHAPVRLTLAQAERELLP